MDHRLQQLTQWLALQLNDEMLTITPVSGDASFRRYFRVEQSVVLSTDKTVSTHWIAMDAPPEKEDSMPFVAIARHWESQNIQVPHIKACDLTQGFMLLDDFGDELMLNTLSPPFEESIATTIYEAALQSLIDIQQCSQPENYTLPPYNTELLSREMELFREWLVSKKLGLNLTPNDHKRLDDAFQYLVNEALRQPKVCVHRDYHSRNLMKLADQSIGVLDFQDAVIGPITYDLVSLLRDCYIALPKSFVEQRLQSFYQASKAAGLHSAEYIEFKQWFDLMGIQRHLKAAGIFARLSMRDGKHGYLNDIPRTVNYIADISAQYAPLNEFNEWLITTVIPAIALMSATKEEKL